jgi:DNA polymerase III delta subunit
MSWSDRDVERAEKWAIDEAKNMGFSLDKKSAQTLVQRVGVDQWGLFHALEKLSLTDVITPDVINNLIESSPQENAFNLLDSALNGDKKRVHEIILSLEQTDDIYKLFGLISSQAFQLAAFVTAGPNDNPTHDLAIHPYSASKIKQAAKQVNGHDIAKIIKILSATDDDMKMSRADPWLLIERAMIEIASLK